MASVPILPGGVPSVQMVLHFRTALTQPFKGTFINRVVPVSEFTLLRTREAAVYRNFPIPGSPNRIVFFLIHRCWRELRLTEKFQRIPEDICVRRTGLIWTFLQHPA